MHPLSPADARARFPALRGDTIYLDNAGGSQLPEAVVTAMRDYLTSTYVQLGADYRESVAATATVAKT